MKTDPAVPSFSITAIKNIPEINTGDNIPKILESCLIKQKVQLQNNDILVFAQKIISKSEDRFIDLRTIQPSKNSLEIAKKVEKDPQLVELILQESKKIIRAEKGLLIVEHKLGHILANAGVDRSNIAKDDNHVLLLPKNPNRSAEKIKKFFGEKDGISLGVLITDSIGRAWRLGTTGHALGSSGIKTIIDLRQKEFDREGRVLQTTIIGIADQIASASTLIMGESNEGIPVVLVRGLELQSDSDTVADLIRPAEEDLFR